MSKARITYRFDNETQQKPAVAELIQSEQQDKPIRAKDNVYELYQEDSDYTSRQYDAWHSPFDVETEQIEQLIRNVLLAFHNRFLVMLWFNCHFHIKLRDYLLLHLLQLLEFYFHGCFWNFNIQRFDIHFNVRLF